MTIQRRAVSVKTLPEISSGKHARTFLREIHASMDADHPRLVLDCSNVGSLGKSIVHLLLCCLEEAMKRNGDIRLAALPVSTMASPERARLDRLFNIYDTTDQAVDSFDRFPAGRNSKAIGTDEGTVPAGSGEK